MNELIPHPIPYQGSKRALARRICALMPSSIETFYEPFAGSAAVTLFAARHDKARQFVLGDSLPQLIELWRNMVADPDGTSDRYEAVWVGETERGTRHFNAIRERFNEHGDPVDLLYLVARCVKNAVRFNRHGRFTQSADKRRLGMAPAKMRFAMRGASNLLKGRTTFFNGDFSDCTRRAESGDFVYMDPPYQGTTYGPDTRYFAQLKREHLIDGLSDLNDRKVPFLLSYDGSCGDVTYGEPLPDRLDLFQMSLQAGRSSQATLNGIDAMTVESLYLSNGLHAFSATVPVFRQLELLAG